jgi:hypothetical protein
MKRILIIIGLLAVTIPGLKAQELDDERIEKLKAYRVSYITNKVNLTSEEAQKFWPLFNDLTTEIERLKKEKMEYMRDIRITGIDNLSEENLKEMIEKNFEWEQRELDLKKKYGKEFQKVLPIRKVALYYRAEKEFKKDLLERLGRGRDGRR